VELRDTGQQLMRALDCGGLAPVGIVHSRKKLSLLVPVRTVSRSPAATIDLRISLSSGDSISGSATNSG
jgi:hypothetical protein